MKESPNYTVVLMATREYLRRQARKSHPKGRFSIVKDSKVFYLSKHEICECCKAVSKPSYEHPHTENIHGRSAKHVASLYGVTEQEILNKEKELKNAA